MKTKKSWYFLLVLLITSLIYNQSWGLNMFLISCAGVLFSHIFNHQHKTLVWWTSALIWLGSGLSLTLADNVISIFLYYFTFLNFVTINHNQNLSFPFSIIHSFSSFIYGLFKFVTPTVLLNLSDKLTDQEDADIIETTEKKIESNKYAKKVFIYGLPLLIVFIFITLYKNANPQFAAYINLINLSFINWNFILVYVLILFLLYGLFLFNKSEKLTNWDLNTKNIIPSNYTDKLQLKVGIDTEISMAKLLLVVLNIILIFFLIIDGISVFGFQKSSLTHAQGIHQGITILICSILLVIIIVGFIYRGALNHKKNKAVKKLTILWLVLNLIVVGFNSIKNFNYINDWGLTHKRIGVYLYLSLCIIGILFTIYKVIHQKSFAYLIRNVSLSFTSILVVFSLFSWHTIIAKYNLNDQRFTENKINFEYNLSLGFEAYPAMLVYFKRHPNTKPNIQISLTNKIADQMFDLDYDLKNAPSFKLSTYLTYQKLYKYHTNTQGTHINKYALIH